MGTYETDGEGCGGERGRERGVERNEVHNGREREREEEEKGKGASESLEKATTTTVTEETVKSVLKRIV